MIRELVRPSEGAATVAPPTATSMATLLSRHVLRDGELVVLLLKPSAWFILLSSLRFIAIVVIVDDILDSGGTIKTVVPLVQSLGAASVKTCVLLRKDRPAAKEVTVEYVGFEIPDEFVVGYGLDYNNYYRNLPDIVTLKPEAIARAEDDKVAR